MDVVIMDIIIRWLGIVVLGAALVVVNYWFVRSVYQQLVNREVVILPFSFATGEDEKGQRGLALARLFGSRLASIHGDIARVQQVAATALATTAEQTHFDVIPLIFPQTAEIPASLFEPLDLSLTVAGVEVGGLIARFQRLWVSQRTLAFTVIPKEEGRVTVTADMTSVLGPGNQWFSVESEGRSDEIASNIAYALLQRRIAKGNLITINEVKLSDFRRLVEIIVEVSSLNERVRAGVSSERRFIALLPELEKLANNLPDWHELTYLTASVAEGAGNRRSALAQYARLWAETELKRRALPEPLRSAVLDRLGLRGDNVEPKAEGRRLLFAARARAFARLMDLPGADPEIALGGKLVEDPNAYAVWNREKYYYEVNPSHVDEPGLPQYVAIMGRFMAKHFERCFSQSSTAPQEAQIFWNEFRTSVVGYLIRSVPEFSKVQFYPQYQSFSRILKYMERSNPDSVKRLAIELLDGYECDWTRRAIREKVKKIDHERGLLLAHIIDEAFESEPDWRDDTAGETRSSQP
jgi:hypothetical protein